MKRRKSRKISIKSKLKTYRDRDGVQKETLPEKMFRELLDSLYVSYKQEYKLSHREKVKSYDFCIYQYKVGSEDFQWRILCEIQGDFWHGSDFFTGKKKRFQLTKIQKRNIKNDILKYTIANNYKIPIIYIWEHELKNDLGDIREKVKRMINNVRENNQILTEEFKNPYVELK